MKEKLRDKKAKHFAWAVTVRLLTKNETRRRSAEIEVSRERETSDATALGEFNEATKVVDLCVLQQPKPGEPLYAQVNLEKKKKRQYELGVGQAGIQGGQVGIGVGGGVGGAPGAAAPLGSQWLGDGVVGQETAPTSTVNVPPNSTAVSAGDSWV